MEDKGKKRRYEWVIVNCPYCGYEAQCLNSHKVIHYGDARDKKGVIVCEQCGNDYRANFDYSGKSYVMPIN